MKNIMLVLVLSIILVTQTKVYSQEANNSNTTINQKREEVVIDLSNSETDSDTRHGFMFLRITPLVVPGIAVGHTNRLSISGDKVIDITVAVNYHDWDLFVPGIFKSLGVSLITEHFSNPKATGFFSRLNLGAEYINKPSSEEKAGWIPNATIGFGHSMQFNKTSYIRLSLEIGYTAILVRINIEFVL